MIRPRRFLERTAQPQRSKLGTFGGPLRDKCPVAAPQVVVDDKAADEMAVTASERPTAVERSAIVEDDDPVLRNDDCLLQIRAHNQPLESAECAMHGGI